MLVNRSSSHCHGNPRIFDKGRTPPTKFRFFGVVNFHQSQDMGLGPNLCHCPGLPSSSLAARRARKSTEDGARGREAMTPPASSVPILEAELMESQAKNDEDVFLTVQLARFSWIFWWEDVGHGQKTFLLAHGEHTFAILCQFFFVFTRARELLMAI